MGYNPPFVKPEKDPCQNAKERIKWDGTEFLKFPIFFPIYTWNRRPGRRFFIFQQKEIKKILRCFIYDK